MKDIVTFSEKTKADVTEQIKAKEALIKNNSSQERVDAISQAINQNQTSREKSLTIRKNKKFNRLKYPSNHTNERQGRSFASKNQESRQKSTSRSRSRNRKTFPTQIKNPHNNAPTYSSILQHGKTKQHVTIAQ